MNTTLPPRLATWLLQRLGATNDALAGDLLEEYRSGRSAIWYWRQVLASILLGPLRQITADPLSTIRAVGIGWVTLAVVFGVFEEIIAARFTKIAYATGVWWPFWITAFFVSYAGFALSAWIVARLHRVNSGPLLLLYISSVLVAMAIAATIVQLRSPSPIRVPHILFPLVSVTLPYQWRSGFLLAPAVMLVVGLLGAANSRTSTDADPVSP